MVWGAILEQKMSADQNFQDRPIDTHAYIHSTTMHAGAKLTSKHQMNSLQRMCVTVT